MQILALCRLYIACISAFKGLISEIMAERAPDSRVHASMQNWKMLVHVFHQSTYIIKLL